jgi:hypothetical protein
VSTKGAHAYARDPGCGNRPATDDKRKPRSHKKAKTRRPLIAASSAFLVPLLSGMASATGAQPEKGQAGGQAMDLHRDCSCGLPVGARQP